MRPQLSNIGFFDPEKLDEVISDLKLELEDVVFHVAVDPHEIFDFCFPIDPRQDRQVEINQLADEQTALYEVFYLINKPILLNEYTYEIEGLASYFKQSVEDIYNETAVIDNMILELKSSKFLPKDKSNKFTNDSINLENLVSNKFNVLLTVAMGIYSIGVKRFVDIINNRLATIEVELPTLSNRFRKYVETYLAQELFFKMVDELESLGNSDSIELKRRRRAAKADARAIDRLIYMNNVLEDAYLNKEIKNRHIVLYLSSAHRTETIFRSDELIKKLPIINSKPFQFWRTRLQFFTYVAHKGQGANRKDIINRSIKNLELIRTIGDIEFQKNISIETGECGKCILEGGIVHNCIWLNTCKSLLAFKKDMGEKKIEILNTLGIMSTLDKYKKLLEVEPKQRYKTYYELFRKIIQSDLKTRALDKMYNLQNLFYVQSRFMSFVPKEWSNQKTISPLHEGRDDVTSISQYLPTQINISAKKYQSIYKLLLKFYKKMPSELMKSRQLIDDAYSEYIDLDTKIFVFNAEHELLRCLLYMAFPSVEGDIKAYEHAVETLNKIQNKTNYKRIRLEYYCVICWASRRSHKYFSAIEYADKAIKEYPQDPRPYHARSLAIYSWIESGVIDGCPFNMNDAIEDANNALLYYQKQPKRNKELISVLYNDLCYFHVLNSKMGELSDHESYNQVVYARKFLQKLKISITKDKWKPRHPEFFHTEAFLEYHEYLHGMNQEKNKKYLIDKLNFAIKEIDIAIELYPKQKYIGLRDSINKALAYLKS